MRVRGGLNFLRGGCGLYMVRVVHGAGAGRARVEKFFVRVTEC